MAVSAVGCSDSGGNKTGEDPCEALSTAVRCDAEGDLQCGLAGTAIQACTADADGCLVWSTTATCGNNQDCVTTDNTPSCDCLDACAEGVSVCSGTAIMTCEADADGCLAWSLQNDCDDTAQLCDDSTDPPECVSECISNCVTESATACAGTLIQTCTDVGDGCLQWRDGTDCDDTTQLCDDEGGTAECYTPCVSTCTTALTNQCAGTMLQTCTDVGDGCLQWQDDTECDPGVCANGLGCVLCTPGSNACDGNTSLTCRADGSGYDETSECDPVMGSACDAGTGL
ncbi:MAG: hypothetical protein CVU65_18025, partial [Deltaproteobacteria bacterium HGW-Deltaproteobacteria-22]